MGYERLATVILSAAKDLQPLLPEDEILRCAQDDSEGDE
jgi:hypothetical protein